MKAISKGTQESPMLEFPKILEEHHLYHEWFLNERAGGPPGYLANLLCGYNQIDHYDRPLIVFNSFKGKEPPKNTPKTKGIKTYLRKMFFSFPNGEKFYKKHISSYQKKAFSDMISFLSDLDQIMPDAGLIQQIDWFRTKTVHVHTAPEVIKIKNYLRKNYLDNIKVILTCHTPEALAKEQYALSIASGQDVSRARILAEKWFELEMRAYREADIMIFPSKEATEPLVKDIPNFDEILTHKDVRYLATGSKRLTSQLTTEEAKKKYGVSGKRVVGFIGRHNSVKGYDLLKAAATEVLRNTDDVVFLIGGAQGTEYKPLDDPRWIEAGWVNPGDLLRAVDVFALPNRQTYYDLVLLEVLSMGVPVVATATGGNKSVKEIAQELILCDTDAHSIATHIQSVLDMNAKARKEKGRALVDVYEHYFTEAHMAQRYVDTICQIYEDYNLWGQDSEGDNK